MAWILSWFGVNAIIIDALQPFISSLTLNHSMYYVAFGMIGLVGGAFRRRD